MQINLNTGGKTQSLFVNNMLEGLQQTADLIADKLESAIVWREIGHQASYGTIATTGEPIGVVAVISRSPWSLA